MSNATISSMNHEPVDDSNEPACRICHMTQSDDPSRPLYHPCHCKGSIRLIHADCCLTWLALKQQSRCEICTWPIQVEAKWDNSASTGPTWIDAAIVAGKSAYQLADELLQYHSQYDVLRLTGLAIILKLASDTSEPIVQSFYNIFTELSFSHLVSLTISFFRICAVTLSLSWLFVLVTISLLFQVCVFHHRLLHMFFTRLEAKTRIGFIRSFHRSVSQMSDLILGCIHIIMEADDVGAIVEITNTLHVLFMLFFVVVPHVIITTIFWGIQSVIPDETIFSTVVNAFHPRSLSFTLLQSAIALYNGGLTALLPEHYSNDIMQLFTNALPSSLIVISREQLLAINQLIHLSWLVSACELGCLIILILWIIPQHIVRSNSILFMCRTCVLASVKVLSFSFAQIIVIPFVLGVCVHLCLMSAFDQSFQQVIVLFAIYPYSYFFFYVLLGTLYSIAMTNLIHAAIIEVGKKSVVSFLFRDPFDPCRDPYHDVIKHNFLKCVYMCIRSSFFYSFFALLIIYVPLSSVLYVANIMANVTGISLLQGPYLVISLKHEVHVLVTGLALFVHMINVAELKGYDNRWFASVSALLARKFGIATWCVKSQSERLQEKVHRGEVQARQEQLLRDMEQGLVADLEGEAFAEMDMGELAALIDDESTDDDWPQASDEAPHSVAEDQDQVDLRDLTESRATLARTRAATAHDALLERQNRSSIKQFGLRLTGFLMTYVCIILGGVMILRYAIPMFFGRIILRMLPFVTLRNNDLICFVLGSMLAPHIVSSVSKIPQMVRGGNLWAWLSLFKAVMLIVYFGLYFPFGVGLLVQHLVVLPASVGIYQQPLFFYEHTYFIGLVALLLPAMLSVVKQLLEMPEHDEAREEAGGPWTSWFTSVCQIVIRGLRRTRITSLIYETILPSAEACVHSLALPYFFCKVVLPLRVLLPQVMRIDEKLLIRLMRDAAQDSDDDAIISRAIEEGMYRYAFIALMGYRAGMMLIDTLSSWYETYSHSAWQQRYSQQVLVNVESEVTQVNASEGSSDSSNDDDSNSSSNDSEPESAESESDNESESDDVMIVRFVRGQMQREPQIKLEPIDDQVAFD